MNNIPYSTPTDIRAIIHTDLTDTEITTIIQQSDAEINKQIGTQNSDPLITKLSALITAQTIRHRQPASVTIGEYRAEQGDNITTEITSILRLYKQPHIKASAYAVKEEQS